MLENLIPMLQSKDKNTINLARGLILNEPIIADIILNCETRPLKTLFKRRVIKKNINDTITNAWWYESHDVKNYKRIQQIVNHMKLTIENNFYFMYA